MPRWLQWLIVGVVAVVAVVVSVVTFGAGAAFGAMAIGAVAGAVIGGGFELGSQLIAGNGLDWGRIGMAALGGAVAGAISAIPIPGAGILSWAGTFAVGGVAMAAGGIVTGDVKEDFGSFATYFALGGLTNVAARGISNLISNKITQSAANGLQHFSWAGETLGDLVNYSGQSVTGQALSNAASSLIRNSIPTVGTLLLRGAIAGGIVGSILSSIAQLIDQMFGRK